MSSISAAGNKAVAARERFSSPLAALGIALSFILLLFALFPAKKIIEGIDRGSDLSPVALDYRESMLRRRPGDTGLRLDLAEDFSRTGQYHKALRILDGFAGRPPGEYGSRCLMDRCLALKGLLASIKPGSEEARQARQEFTATARELAASGASPQQLLRLALEEKSIGDWESARYLMRRYVIGTALNPELADFYPTADTNLPGGKFRENADMYFSAMGEARTLKARRALFMKGVRSLQAGGLPAEALEAGEKHLGGLESDRRTLVFMANTALAADRPRIAQFFVKRALGMELRAESADVRP